MAFTTLDSPIGELTIVGDDGVVTGIYQPDHEPAPDPTSFGERDDVALATAAEQLREYFAGERTRFNLATRAAGTPFQERVWAALASIPFGEARTYGEIADAIGNPRAVRAVGLANRANPLTIVVPCHRVIAATGALSGYAGGLQSKRALLEHEGFLTP